VSVSVCVYVCVRADRIETRSCAGVADAAFE
jgi:hypothetical protein